MNKEGYKTSEFWIVLLTIGLIYSLILLGKIDPDEACETIIMLSSGYTGLRTYAKQGLVGKTNSASVTPTP